MHFGWPHVEMYMLEPTVQKGLAVAQAAANIDMFLARWLIEVGISRTIAINFARQQETVRFRTYAFA